VTETPAADVQLRVLESLAEAENYNRWLAELTRPHLGDDPVEIGSGLGGNAALWLAAGAPRVTVSELDQATLDRLRQRFAGDERVTVERIDLADPPVASHSACVALNVLEHIEDDVAALRGAGRLVRPGGAVVVFVPAFPFAAGRFDRAIGHFRRYTRRTLTRAFESAGLRVALVRYVNAPGLLAWFLSVRLLGQTPRSGPLLRVWDRSVIPLARRSERHFTPPFGQSVLAVGHTRS
jgi:SAM-dependent methyltransferase